MILNFKRKGKQKHEIPELEEMLNDCVSQEHRMQNIARSNLSSVYSSAITAAERIRLAKTKCASQKFNDPRILRTLENQLDNVDNDLMSTYYEVKCKLDAKSKEKIVFNITLFGRTMVGKSTMMSILTNGNSEAIGKGGQRTTRDVRRYNWHGMTVTDVPGIDAFEGAEDEQIALNAATNADLIIFMIADDAPSDSEAEWLARLVKLDKPMLCLINCKLDLTDEFDRNEFIENPNENGLNPETIREITRQFNEFINKYLPGKQMPFIAVHLQAEWMSRQKQYSSFSKKLHFASQFSVFENALVEEVSRNGLMFRFRSYITTIDSAVYNFSRALLRHSEDSFKGYISIKEKFEEFRKWQSGFNKQKPSSLHESVDELFDRIDNGLPSFIDINIESDNFKQQWERYLSSFSIENKIRLLLESVAHDMQSSIQNIFSELNYDISQTFKLDKRCYTDKADVFNLKRFWGWCSGIMGASGVIAGFIASGPIGWILGGIGAIFGLFSWFSDSRENKLRKAKSDVLSKLREGTSKMRKHAHASITKSWHEDMMPTQTEAYNRLKTLEGIMLSLANVERSLGIAYNRQHRELSNQLIFEAMKSWVNDNYLNTRSICIARIPGRITALLNNTNINLYSELSKSQVSLCLNEELFHWYGTREASFKNVSRLLRLADVRSRFTYKEIPSSGGNIQPIAYIDKTKLTGRDLEKIELIEQLLDIHFMQGYTYEY